MAVREFDGVDDDIRHAAGTALEAMTYGTVAYIAKPSTVAGTRSWGSLHTSGGVLRSFLCTFGGNEPAWFSGGNVSNGDADITAGDWYLVVVRKVSGSALPRFSVYRFNGGTWDHGDGNFALTDWTAPGAGATFRTDDEGSDLPAGRIAVRAVWANEVHWAADGAGDAAIEAAGLETLLDNWLAEGPDAAWRFDQASTATAVDDLIGNADQTAITGTTVITDDDPPGFFFDAPPPEISSDFGLTVALAATTSADHEASVEYPFDVTLSATLTGSEPPHNVSADFGLTVTLSATLAENPPTLPRLRATGVHDRSLYATGVHP